mgnify:CR=1 FL=1|uniref:PorV/PorQ family protein n=1 Tax=candidate division WOR-3 bacterium TaxID=2052148 RepID=A0A7C4CC05_UNCW3
MKTALLLLALTAVALGQSFFNMRGLGEITPATEARQNALGDPWALSLSNPGAFVTLPGTRFDLSALFSALYGRQRGNDRLLGDARPAAFQAAVPLPLDGRIILGLDQRFNQDFNVWSDSTTGPYRHQVIGRGGIHALRAGLAKAFFDRLAIGLEYNYHLGAAREDWRFYARSGSSFSTDTVEIDYSGSGLRAGASFQTSRLGVALLYESQLALTARRYTRIHGVTADSLRTYRLQLPHVAGVGVSGSPLEKLRLVAAVEYRPWSAATVDDTLLGYRDALRISAGGEYDLLENVPLRFGYSHQYWYFDATRGPVTEHAISLGSGLPIPKFGSLDFAGSTALRRAGDLTEITGRLMVTLAYREQWQKRTRRWGY